MPVVNDQAMKLCSSFKYHKMGIKFTAKYKLGETLKSMAWSPPHREENFRAFPG